MLLKIAGETARIGGWIVDLDSETVFWSEEVRAIHEAPPGNPTVDEGMSYYAPEYRDLIGKRFTACARHGTPYDEEMRIVTAVSQQHRWVRAIGRPVYDDRGTITHVQGAFQDITQQKEVETLLQHSQQQFRQLANAMPLIVWTAEPDGVIDYNNKYFAKYTGMTGLNLRAGEWLQIVHSDDIERCLAAWEQSVKTGSQFSIEYRIRRHDGVYRWNLVQAVPIRNSEQTIVKWYGTAIDIHTSREMQEEMRQLANSLTTTLESITDAFCTLNTNWQFTYVNQEAERILERSRGDLLGKSVWDEFQPAVNTIFEWEYRRAMQENTAVAFESYYAPLSRWLEVNAYPSAEGLAIYFRDISQRKEAEHQLQQQLDELRRWHQATLGREMRILDLKKEVNSLLSQAGQAPRYPSALAEEK